MRSFVKIKSSRNVEITLSFTDICKSCHSHRFLASRICLLTLFRENKIHAKISGFTVLRSAGLNHHLLKLILFH